MLNLKTSRLDFLNFTEGIVNTTQFMAMVRGCH